MLEEKLEREHQQALEEARLRAEKREQEEAEKRAQDCAAAAAAQLENNTAVAQSCHNKPGKLQSDTKAMTGAQSIEKRGPYDSQREATLQSKKSEMETRQHAQNASASGSDHSMTAENAKLKEEIQRLRDKVESMEMLLSDKDTHLARLQQQVDYLKKKEKKLEVELAHRPMITPINKTVPMRSTDSPTTISQCENSRIDKSKGSKGLDYASDVSHNSRQGVKGTTPVAKMSAKFDAQESARTDSAQHEGRSHSSGDDTCSDTTFPDHSRCPSQILNSVDHSQVSDSTTHETRSISSFGTQLDHNGHDADGALMHDGQRVGRGYEAVTPSGNEVMKTCQTGHSLHGHVHSGAVQRQCSPPLHGQIYSPLPHSMRANSVASCLPTRQQGVNTAPTLFPVPGGAVSRSYSLDASVRLADAAGPYAPCSSYTDFATTMQDSFGVLCSTMQQQQQQGLSTEFLSQDISAHQQQPAPPEIHRVGLSTTS